MGTYMAIMPDLLIFPPIFTCSIEPRHREKAYTLASEGTGTKGRKDILAWVEVRIVLPRLRPV
jgi:hypothetical protein